jgi:hypothetical protein
MMNYWQQNVAENFVPTVDVRKRNEMEYIKQEN